MEPTASPQVFVNQVEQSVPPSARKFFNLKLAFIIFGIIIIVELIFGLKSVLQSSTGGVTTSNQKAKISILTTAKEFKVGDTIPVTIEITSPTPAGGVDFLAKFDPNILQAGDSNIQTGQIFSQYPISKIDPSGEIRISGITGIGKPGFAGTGTFATINFRAVKIGSAKIMVEQTIGSTLDSNITDLSSAKDNLGEVQNLEINIK